MKKGLVVLMCGVFGLAGQAFAAFTGEGAAAPMAEPLGLLCVGLFLMGTGWILRSRQEKMRMGFQTARSRSIGSRPGKSPA